MRVKVRVKVQALELLPMNTLGERIRFLRGKDTQEAFAVKLGVSKGALGGYERNENSPGADVILKICSATDISVEWLMTGNGPMRSEDEGIQTQTISVTGVIPKKAEKYLMETLYPQLVAEGKAPPICQNCVELYQKLVQVQERENTLLKETAALKAENTELKARLSLSATVPGVSPQQNTA